MSIRLYSSRLNVCRTLGPCFFSIVVDIMMQLAARLQMYCFKIFPIISQQKSSMTVLHTWYSTSAFKDIYIYICANKSVFVAIVK